MTVHDDMWSAGRLLLEATHGRAGTWTKQSSGATTAVTARLRVLDSGTEAVVALKASALSAAPLRDDSIVFTGSSVRWYVVALQDAIGLGGDYVVECKSNEGR